MGMQWVLDGEATQGRICTWVKEKELRGICVRYIDFGVFNAKEYEASLHGCSLLYFKSCNTHMTTQLMYQEQTHVDSLQGAGQKLMYLKVEKAHG